MGRFLPLFLSVVGTLHVIGVSGQSAAECIGRCTNQIRDKFKDLQCADANEAPCFCKNPTFPRAILECSQSCGATMDMITGYLTSDFCKAQGVAKPNEPDAAASPASPPAHSPTHSPTHPAAETPAVASPPAAEHSPTSSSSPTSTPTPTPTSSGAVPTSTVAHPTSTASPSTTTDTTPSATSTPAAASPPAPGLSQAAIAGIGIGTGAAVLAVAGFIVCALMKGRKKNTGRRGDKIEISKPMPGAGRSYPGREDQYRAGRDVSFEKYGPDIEMTANRYEDMVPRTQPRTMV
ncbi:hypothetical protein E4U55_001414 [Claviceps digitariae]|nr:hypothetical protein E4U55_001414 [Claviceps digitariae]